MPIVLIASAAALVLITVNAIRYENQTWLASHEPYEDVRFLTGPDSYSYTTFYNPAENDAAGEVASEGDSESGYDRYDNGENGDVTAESGECDEVLRVYLPAENARISFSHLSGVRIGGKLYHSHDRLSGIASGETVPVAFLGSDGETVSERPVKFYIASGVAAMYIQIKNGDLDDIAADKEVSREIRYETVDADGTLDGGGEGEMHGRGNQSWLYEDKQPYSINLDKAASLLGMEITSKWALLSTPEDYTMMMNKLVLDVCEAIEVPHAVESAYVNLYVDGEYKGVYLLAQRVKNTDGAVQIEDISDATVLLEEDAEPVVENEDGVHEVKYYEASSPSDISGGYLMEFETDSRYAAAEQGFTTEHRYITVHSPEHLSEEEADYISSYVQEAEDAIYHNYGVNPQTGKTWFEYLDASSWIKEFWIQEFFINYDADYTSTFFTKEHGDPLLYAGPCWDFDSTFWHTYYNGTYQSQMLTIRGRKVASWLLQLDAKEDFHLALTQYYLTVFRDAVIQMEENEIPALVEQLGPSLVMMYDRLGYENKDQAYVDGIEEMFDTWIDARLAFLDDFLANPEEYAVLYFLIPENSTHNIVIAVRKGEPVDLSEKIFRRKTWMYGDGQIAQDGDVFYEDTVLTPIESGDKNDEYYYSMDH